MKDNLTKVQSKIENGDLGSKGGSNISKVIEGLQKDLETMKTDMKNI